MITNEKYFLEKVSCSFHGRDIFAPVAAQLSLGVDIKNFGKVLKQPMTLHLTKPKVRTSEIKGEIVYIDTFGNLVTNIPNRHFTDMISEIRCGVNVCNKVENYRGLF